MANEWRLAARSLLVAPGVCSNAAAVSGLEYALVNVPGVWKGGRNPVIYADSLADAGIKIEELEWKPMPEPAEGFEPSKPSLPGRSGRVHPLTLAEAKQGLAQTFGVAPEHVEITIRG